MDAKANEYGVKELGFQGTPEKQLMFPVFSGK